MQYKQLGSTGVYVSRVALGTMTFGGAGHPLWDRIGALGQSDADRLVGRALEAGVNFFDAADAYAGGEAETILGKALGSRRDEVVLTTKFAARVGPGPNDAGASRLRAVRALEGSLRRLGTDYVDLYMLHGTDRVTPIEETLSALDDMVRQGKVRYVGCSNLSAWRTAKALGVSVANGLEQFCTTQVYWSLVSRDVEHEIVPLVEDAGMGLMVFSPLGGGFLTGKITREGATDPNARRARMPLPGIEQEQAFAILDATHAVAARRGASVPQVALAWLLTRDAVTSVVVGARSLDQLEDNLGAVGLELSAEDLAELDAASAPRMQYPAWFQTPEMIQREPLESA